MGNPPGDHDPSGAGRRARGCRAGVGSRPLWPAGVPVVDGPRETGDGYYEATVLDPEDNRVELVASDYSDDVALRPTF